ncbi:MAG TPA: hypothetical protein VGF30_07250, partial [Bacteroidia bacterium]
PVELVIELVANKGISAVVNCFCAPIHAPPVPGTTVKELAGNNVVLPFKVNEPSSPAWQSTLSRNSASTSVAVRVKFTCPDPEQFKGGSKASPNSQP